MGVCISVPVAEGEGVVSPCDAATRTAHVSEEERARTLYLREKAILGDSLCISHVHTEYMPIPIKEDVDLGLAGYDAALD
jgi:hypothetical protein